MSAKTSPWAEFRKRIADASSAKDLDAIDQELFGRKGGVLTLAMQELKNLQDAEKKERAKELNEQKQALSDAIAERRKALLIPSDKDLRATEALDVTLSLPEERHGHLHPVPEMIAHVEEVFGRMGFDVWFGPEVETEDYNFNLLNIHEDHAARDGADTFMVEDKKEKLVLRTHTSPVQIHYMQTHKPPFRMICPGKVYRKDDDATHSPMFHQFEGLMIGKDVSLAHLKGVLVTAMRELMGRDVEFRFRTGYFPFVEPGLEMDMKWQGDLDESREGAWLEMGGCGMVHPNVLKNVGIDPDAWQGFAFGFGIERPLMIKHQIPDLRSFFRNDPRFLRQF